jgi:hypothetical protein
VTTVNEPAQCQRIDQIRRPSHLTTDLLDVVLGRRVKLLAVRPVDLGDLRRQGRTLSAGVPRKGPSARRRTHACQQRIVRVRLEQEVVDAQQDWGRATDSVSCDSMRQRWWCGSRAARAGGARTRRHLGRRLPLLRLEQGDADVALVVDIWVINARAKLDLQKARAGRVSRSTLVQVASNVGRPARDSREGLQAAG